MIAWSVGVAAVALVALRYEALPSTLPLTRWSAAPKTWLVALRAPAICVVSLGMVEVLCAAVRRAPDFERGDALTATLLLTAAWKAAMAAVSLLLLPQQLLWLDVLWIGVTIAGMSFAVWIGRELLRAGRLRRLLWTRNETGLLLVLTLVLLALELPMLGTHASSS